MPLYEYQCTNCDKEFTKRRAIKEADAPVECPDCESEEVTRKMSLFVAFTKGDSGSMPMNAGGGGGCCGGACGCGGHSMN
jgi:putative FmdB family regulatory protein